MSAVTVRPAFNPRAESIGRFAVRAEIARRVTTTEEEWADRRFAAELKAIASTERYRRYMAGELSADSYYRGNPPPAEMVTAWNAIVARPGAVS